MSSFTDSSSSLNALDLDMVRFMNDILPTYSKTLKATILSSSSNIPPGPSNEMILLSRKSIVKTSGPLYVISGAVFELPTDRKSSFETRPPSKSVAVTSSRKPPTSRFPGVPVKRPFEN